MMVDLFVVAAVAGIAFLTVWTVRRDIREDRARVSEHHRLIVESLQTRQRYLEEDVKFYRTPSLNGNGPRA